MIALIIFFFKGGVCLARYFFKVVSFQMFLRIGYGECCWRFHLGTGLILNGIVGKF